MTRRTHERAFAWILTSIAALCLQGCGAFGEDAAITEGEVYVEAAKRAIEIRVPAKGELESLSASPIGVPRVPTGALKVKELVAEGSLVEKGDVVIVFDDTQLSLELANHESTFRSANRRIDRTGLDAAIEAGNLEVLREVAELTRENAVEFQLDDEQIYSALERLESEVARTEAEETILYAEASLMLKGEFYDIEGRILGVEKREVKGKIDRVETSLANLVLRAPIGGMIVYRKNWRGGSVSIGDSLWPGNVVMSIVDPSKSSLKAFVLERDAAGIEQGAMAEVRVDAMPLETFSGEVLKVSKISRPIERGSPVKYFEVEIEMKDGPLDVLKPGMKGEARIATDAYEDAVVIPRAAVRGNGESQFVVVRRSGGNAVIPVALGSGDQVLATVAVGLEGGERLVLGGEDPALPDDFVPAVVERPATPDPDPDPETRPGERGKGERKGSRGERSRTAPGGQG